MDGISSATSTDRMLQQLAQDSGQEGLDHYTGPMNATMSQKKTSLETDQNRSILSSATKVGAMGAAKVFGATFTSQVEHAADLASATIAQSAPALRGAAAGNAIVGTIGMAYEMMDEGFVRAHAHGDAIRAAGANDAAVVGMTQALDVPAGFKATMSRMRSETATQGGAAYAAQLAGKDKGMVPVLQLRTDAGLLAAKPWAEAMVEAKATDERAAVMRNFQKTQTMEHANRDAAFGLGVAEALWAVGAKQRGELTPEEYNALFEKAGERVDAGKYGTHIRS